MDPSAKHNNLEGRLQLPLQAAQTLSPRIINHLPLPPLINYSPHQALEFDPSVFDFCRNNRFIKSNLNFKSHFANYHLPNNSGHTSRTCKVIVSGDVAVGKTCLVNRFSHDIYTNDYQTTIGVDFDIQKFSILGQPYAMQIWDTAGLERFKCITNSYYRGCQAALLVFDLTNVSTLANVLRWKEEVLNSAKTFDQMVSETDNHPQKPTKPCQDHKPLLFLVGTKCDLPMAESSKSFVREHANKIARLIGAELWFVSAQSGENVNELFNRIAGLCFNRSILGEVQKLRFETSTLGAGLKEKIMQQQKELWAQSAKFIKITRKKDGDHRRSRCINIQFFIK